MFTFEHYNQGKYMKYLSLVLAVLAFNISVSTSVFAQGTQNTIVRAMEDCVYTPLPYYLIPYSDSYSCSNYSVSFNDFSFILYEDAQCTKAVPTENCLDNMPSLEAKIEFGNKCLCVFRVYDAEFGGNCLSIVDNTGKVYDKLFVGLYCGVFISRQFRIDENGIITVYYFVPDSTNTIYLETLGRFLPTLHGKICTETYNVVNDKFVLQSQEYGPNISCNLKQDKENNIVRNLWDL